MEAIDPIQLAMETANRAYVPYSHFPIGAGQESENGKGDLCPERIFRG